MYRYMACVIVAFCLCGQGGAEPVSNPLPDDIDPGSLSRLPLLKRSDLDADGQCVYDMVFGRERLSPLPGPGGISMYSPKVAEAMHIMNTSLRTAGVLSPRFSEIAILVAAREINQQYEWTLHEPAARRAGATDAVIEAIKYDRDVAGLAAEDSLIIRVGRQLLREHRLSSDLYAEAVQRFGQRGMVELSALIGDYVMAGIMLHAADQHLPPERPALLPMR